MQISILFLASCAPARPHYQVEVVTVEQQTLEELAQVKTTFTVPAAEARYSWERVLLFFDSHTSKTHVDEMGINHLIVSNRSAAKDAFLYEVDRQMHPSGDRYSVNCSPRKSSALRDAADRNSRNLARFINEGRLELSLLIK